MSKIFEKIQLKQLKQFPRVVKVLMLHHFFEGFVPIMAFYAIMFERVGGLSLDQIGLLFAIWSLAFLIAELPSGVLADYWSRRNVIVIGGFLRAIGFGIWLLWPNFLGYAIGFALWGAMIAFSSGAVPAFLHDELKSINKSKKFAKYFGWVNSAHWVGALFGLLLASIMGFNNTTLLIILSLVSSLLAGLTLFSVSESYYSHQSSYIKTLKSGLKELLSSAKLRYLSFGLFSIFMIIGVLEELLPRVYVSFGINDRGIAIVLAVSLLLTIFMLTKLEKLSLLSLKKQISIMMLGMGFLLVGLYVGNFGGVVLIVFFALIFNLFRPLFSFHVQEAVIGNEKATISSIPGLAGGLLGAGAYIVIGNVAESTSELYSIGLYGGFWLLVLFVYDLLGKSYRVKKLQKAL